MTKSIIKPSVGRRLWYWPSPADRDGAARPAICSAGDQPCDAGVAYVWNDRCVNLTVADHNGEMHSRCSVRLIQEGDAPPGEGEAYAQWMPYQQGQAKAEPVPVGVKL